MTEELYGLREYLDLKFDTIDVQLKEIKDQQRHASGICENTRCLFDNRIDVMEKKWAELNGVAKEKREGAEDKQRRGMLFYTAVVGVSTAVIAGWEIFKNYVWK